MFYDKDIRKELMPSVLMNLSAIVAFVYTGI